MFIPFDPGIVFLEVGIKKTIRFVDARKIFREGFFLGEILEAFQRSINQGLMTVL